MTSYDTIRLLYKQLTCSGYLLTQLVHRGTFQGQAHGTVRSNAVLPVRYDLTRGGTVRICNGEERRGRIEGGEREERGRRREERGRRRKARKGCTSHRVLLKNLLPNGA